MGELKKKLGSLILQMETEIKETGYSSKYISCFIDEENHIAAIWNTQDTPDNFYLIINLEKEAMKE